MHRLNMLILDGFRDRAGYARYCHEFVASTVRDEGEVAWRAYKSLGLDCRADRSAFLQLEKQACLELLDQFGVHPQEYHRSLRLNVAL